MTNKENFLLYGSYGYTGNLIAELAIKQGLKPILAGRNKEKLMQQASALNLEYRVIDLDDTAQLEQALADYIAVVNCAGPFIHTCQKMVAACLKSQTHYLDITGEYEVFEQLMQNNDAAKNAGVMLLPGAGFDVVPSDCLALHLKELLPDANELVLAIYALSNKSGKGLGVSRGTARTMMEGMSSGTMIREQGTLKSVPLSSKVRAFDFGNEKNRLCSLVSWGDISSAWWSTKIPNIETYMSLPKQMINFNQWINPIKFIINWAPIKRFINNKINQLPEGPTLDERNNSETKIYGEVSNATGKKEAAILTTPNGYSLTAATVLLIVNKTLQGNAPVGYQTPASAYGKDLILEVDGVTRVAVHPTL